MSDKYEYPEDLTEEEKRALEHARSMITTEWHNPKPKASPKEIFFSIVAIICFLGSIFFVDSILDFFHVPGSSIISCIIWPCILGLCVYYFLSNYKK